MFKKIIGTVLTLSLVLCGCARNDAAGRELSQSPASPTPFVSPITSPVPPAQMTDEPELNVYIVAEENVHKMPMEEYLLGVLAGEMQNDWPLEALKAQAIIARTFAVKFLRDKGEGASKYEGADISTDIEEAQAYDAQGINERIRQAVEETRGLVITHQGEPVYAWFHSHSGGQTALAVEGLDYEGVEQAYIKSVKSNESAEAPEETTEWSATFSAQEIINAAGELGIDISSAAGMKIGALGESGRVAEFDFGGVSVPAAALRVKLGADKMRSTLIDRIDADNAQVVFSGRGYGHGVGMSQWGAFAMANEGRSAEEIVEYYYADVAIEQLWR